MAGLTFYKDYKNDDKLRKSFNELAALVFGLDFEDWYEKGYWDNRYIPFSYTAGDKIIANASVNLVDFVINGEKKRAIQIGTVMTHPDYRNRGLSTKLMNKVLEEYEATYDFLYLFANQTVLDFYPKFGFQPIHEHQFSMTYSPTTSEATGIRKLDGSNKKDLDLIYKIASERVPVSNLFGTQNTPALLIFYCIYVFKDDIYYIESEETIVIFKSEGKQVDIFDIISKKEASIDPILSTITNSGTDKVVFHYTPPYKEMDVRSDIFNGSEVLFVKAKDIHYFPAQFKHPVTSQA